jgi:hypothetical protein
VAATLLMAVALVVTDGGTAPFSYASQRPPIYPGLPGVPHPKTTATPTATPSQPQTSIGSVTPTPTASTVSAAPPIGIGCLAVAVHIGSQILADALHDRGRGRAVIAPAGSAAPARDVLRWDVGLRAVYQTGPLAAPPYEDM